MWHKIVIICSITVLVSIQDGVELHCVRLCRYAKQKTSVVHRNLQFKHKTRNTCLGWRDEAADGGCVETTQYLPASRMGSGSSTLWPLSEDFLMDTVINFLLVL